MRVRKRAIEVDAVEYVPGLEDGFVYDIPMFGLFTRNECVASGFTPDFEHDAIPYIQTPEGKMFISDGDLVITGIDGERYPIKPDIFAKTYECVSE